MVHGGLALKVLGFFFLCSDVLRNILNMKCFICTSFLGPLFFLSQRPLQGNWLDSSQSHPVCLFVSSIFLSVCDGSQCLPNFFFFLPFSATAEPGLKSSSCLFKHFSGLMLDLHTASPIYSQ